MKTLFSRLALVSLVVALAPAAHATADGPDAWRVIDVAPTDVLNARVGPGTDYMVIDALPFNARGVQVEYCVPTVTRDQYFALTNEQQQALNAQASWCLVIWDGLQRGWVNRRFLTEDSF